MERKEIIWQKGHEVPFGEEFDRLSELAKEHKVCWEAWPEYHMDREGKIVQIGFELDLIGPHHDPQNPPAPGCDECVKVYEVGVFDSTIHYSAQRKFRGEVVLPIKILHRERFHLPTDEYEIRCLNEMEENLKSLGAQKERWSEPAQ